MKTITVFTILLIYLTLQCTFGNQMDCYQTIGDIVYDLTPISKVVDYQVSLTPDLYIQYQICDFIKSQCDNTNSFASLYSRSSSTTCIRLTTNTKEKGIYYDNINPEDPLVGIKITFNEGAYISESIIYPNSSTYNPNNMTLETNNMNNNTNQTYSFILNLYCDENVTNIMADSVIYDTTQYAYIADVRSINACPMISMSIIANFVNDYWIMFTVFGVIIGLGEALFGIKLLYTTLFLSGFGSGFILTLFIFFSYALDASSTEAAKWVTLFFSLIFGSFFGYITLRQPKVGLFILGVWLGCIISLILFNAVLYNLSSDIYEYFLYALLGLLAIIFGLISIFFQDYLLIAGTSFVGSYVAIRSISLGIGGFPSEFAIIQQLKLSNYTISVTWEFYVYMNAIFVLTLISLYIQCKIKKKLDEAKMEKDAYYKVDI